MNVWEAGLGHDFVREMMCEVPKLTKAINRLAEATEKQNELLANQVPAEEGEKNE